MGLTNPSFDDLDGPPTSLVGLDRPNPFSSILVIFLIENTTSHVHVRAACTCLTCMRAFRRRCNLLRHNELARWCFPHEVYRLYYYVGRKVGGAAPLHCEACRTVAGGAPPTWRLYIVMWFVNELPPKHRPGAEVGANATTRASARGGATYITANMNTNMTSTSALTCSQQQLHCSHDGSTSCSPMAASAAAKDCRRAAPRGRLAVRSFATNNKSQSDDSLVLTSDALSVCHQLVWWANDNQQHEQYSNNTLN